MLRRPLRSTRTDTLFPYTTLFRSRSAALSVAPSSSATAGRSFPACCPFGIDRAIELEEVARARIPTPAVHPRDQLHRGRVDMEPVTIDKLVADMEAENLGDNDGRRLGFARLEQTAPHRNRCRG